MGRKARNRKSGRQAPESGGSDMKKLYIGLAVAAVLGVAAVGYMNSGGGNMATAPVELPEMTDPELVEAAQGLVMGSADAPLTIVEFGDYQCPGCGAFASLVKPQIESAYVESGQARFVFYDFPLVSIHPNAFLAARAARCAADQDLGWEYHEALFANQTEWAQASNPAGRFIDYAEGVGADAGAFGTCLRSDRHADLVTANLRLGERLGVGSTPTVMVNDGQGNTTRVPNSSFTGVSEVVDGMIGAGEEDTSTDDSGAATDGQGG